MYYLPGSALYPIAGGAPVRILGVLEEQAGNGSRIGVRVSYQDASGIVLSMPLQRFRRRYRPTEAPRPPGRPLEREITDWAEWFRAWRVGLGLSRGELAILIGVRERRVGDLERHSLPTGPERLLLRILSEDPTWLARVREAYVAPPGAPQGQESDGE